MAVNVSAVQFRQENFCALVRNVPPESGISPEYLELEITESLFLSNGDAMLSRFRELKEMGLKLAIDDFGTGYSSLAYLKQFPVDKLKIDQAFISDIAVDDDDASITAAIINMAKSHLHTIAEGVETEAQMSFLRKHHCDEIPGYYFSKALSAGAATSMLRLNQNHRATSSEIEAFGQELANDGGTVSIPCELLHDRLELQEAQRRL
jgi:EAL domain-containing protein (putative c-di-GMP-specific phosphodiesterase class I)